MPLPAFDGSGMAAVGGLLNAMLENRSDPLEVKS
jgi:hypothetical protein